MSDDLGERRQRLAEQTLPQQRLSALNKYPQLYRACPRRDDSDLRQKKSKRREKLQRKKKVRKREEKDE
jgi:hypothetical protein